MTKQSPVFTKRYDAVTREKAHGATYTPKTLADFVARRIIECTDFSAHFGPLNILDPAVGEGELLASLLECLHDREKLHVYGFDTNEQALGRTKQRLHESFPAVSLHLTAGDFLEFVLDICGGELSGGLFKGPDAFQAYDLIIANPPYVRTQVMGAQQARTLSRQFGLAGRVDLYHAFILAMAKVLAPQGTAGIILSNRFMTTKAGANVRAAIRRNFNLAHVWDLGDTKLFDAAVLPAVLLVHGRSTEQPDDIAVTSIYETENEASSKVLTAIDALGTSGVTEVRDGRRFLVRHGELDSRGLSGVWRIATEESDVWLSTVSQHTWKTFGDIAKIRVGVKTCADQVFIGTHWNELPEAERPELLRPLITHHMARRFKPEKLQKPWHILYPHQSSGGRRFVVDLNDYPRSRTYLDRHRDILENRKYVLEAGREWYEVWVPQNPAAWNKLKLVFRDISEHPIFWIDGGHSVVNGDCYWMACDREEDEDLLWMAAAIGNSSFIEAFYDHCFNNKLYAGRRRFITQYVEKFPLPNPQTTTGKAIIQQARCAFDVAGTPEAEHIVSELDCLVWKAFGLSTKEIAR